VTIRLDHLLLGIFGIALAALALFFGAQRLLHHHHAGMAIQPGLAHAIEAGFIQKATANHEFAQCSPSTYEITCSVAGKDSVVHKVQITRVSFCNYAGVSDGEPMGTFNICARKASPSKAADLGIAMADVRSAIPDMEAYYSDHSSFRGTTLAALRSYDSGVPRTISVVTATAENYCIESNVDGTTASVSGPGGTVKPGACP
jgi:hypothetical protein